MACHSALGINKDDSDRIGTIGMDDILTQNTNVRSLQKPTMCPEDIELSDNENSCEENNSCIDDNVDSDEYEEEDTRFLDVCMDGDIEDLVQLLEEMAQAGETLSVEMLNCADSTGRVPVSYLCGNGMIEMLELVEDIPGIAFNTPDTEGNTPLHLAGQAGHVEVVTFLLNKVRTIQVDPINVLGFTPLMKAAIQGRVKCSKLLLISGASSSRRDFGRGYTAPQWARYLGRDLCAESMEKFVRTAAVPGVSLADILTDPRTLIKDIEKSNAHPSRSSKTPTKLKDMLKKKSSILYNKVGRGKRRTKERPLSIDSNFGSSSFSEDVDDIPATHSKSWFTKALRKVLKVPSTYNNKPIKQTVFEDQSLTASSNGYQDACDGGSASFASQSDNIPRKSKVSTLSSIDEAVSRTSERCESENDILDREKTKDSDMSYVGGKKKASNGGGANTRCNEYSNMKPRKRFAIPEIQVTKVEKMNFNSDEEDSS